MNVDRAYELILQILSLGLLLGSFEALYTSNFFLKGQPFDWRIVKPDAIIYEGRAFKLLNSLYSQNGIRIIMGFRIFAIIPILIPLHIPALYTVSIGLVTATTFLVYYRHSYGMDGSDQMSFVILLTTFLCSVVYPLPEIKRMGLIFIGAQLSVAYLSSGISKLISSKWRSGLASEGVLSTYTYGTRLTRVLVKYQPFNYFICWFTIIYETLFPLALFLSNGWVIAWLVVGFLFHLGIAVTMGLNNFVWAFTAGYPAFYYLAVYVLRG